MSQNPGARPATPGAAAAERSWADAARPLAERVEALLAAMSLDEKLASSRSVWIGAEVGHRRTSRRCRRRSRTRRRRPRPAPTAWATSPGRSARARSIPSRAPRRLAELQAELVARTRLEIPAIAHEECLTGFTTYGATVFPTPLGLAATFDPDVGRADDARDRESRCAPSAPPGLSPVLDVVRDYRWGRVEETFGEDPYLVGMMGARTCAGSSPTGWSRR
jgi:beta-glucosidase-like glycosyl hydrolase